MLSVRKRIYSFLTLLAALLALASSGAASTLAGGYVPITFGTNPVSAGSNTLVLSSPALDYCLTTQGSAGTLSIYVSTSETGGTYLGRDFGTGVIFNSIDYGNQFNAAHYYFYAYYTSNGSNDPCAGVVSLSSTPQWAVLTVTGN